MTQCQNSALLFGLMHGVEDVKIEEGKMKD